MLGFINTGPSRHIKKLFQFPAVPMDFPDPDMTLDSPARGSSVPLSSLPDMNAAMSGIAFTARFSNADWTFGSNEMLFAIGDSNNYIYFQKRISGLKFRWGLVSNGTIILIDEFSVDFLYNGMMTIGASIRADRIDFCVNGYTVGYQTDGITLPAITAVNTVEIGRFFGGAQTANPSVAFDSVKIWTGGLSTIEIENATYEAEPLQGAARQSNLWTLIKAGQSNSSGASIIAAPPGLAYRNPGRIHMINKDLTIRPYADPYSTLAYGNELAAYDEAGGYSGAGVTIDTLASRYGACEFAAMPCNKGGTGLIHDGGEHYWTDEPSGEITTGNPKKTTSYALAAYLSMLVAKQKSNLLAIEWYQGETDAVDGSAVSADAYKAALAGLFDKWRLVLPPLRVVVGLCAAPSGGFSNWPVIQQALAEFIYPQTYFVDANGLSTIGSEPYHLDSQGQYDLGLMVATELKKRI